MHVHTDTGTAYPPRTPPLPSSPIEDGVAGRRNQNIMGNPNIMGNFNDAVVSNQWQVEEREAGGGRSCLGATL